MASDSSPFAIRISTEADIPAVLALSALADWNQTAAGWRRILDFQPDGCFLAERDGQVCGSVTTTEYGGRFGWIGMMLVHPDFRRRGIGKALLQRAIDYLRAVPTETIKLDATDLGKKLYDTFGFQSEYPLERWGGKVVSSGEQAARATQDDLDDIVALDAIAFGAERGRVLRRLTADNPDHSWIVRDDNGTLLGYAMARRGRKAWQIGPCIARNPDAGRDLVGAPLSSFAGEDILVDIVPFTPILPDLRRSGLRPLRSLTRMYIGPNRHPGRPEMTITVGAFEKG